MENQNPELIDKIRQQFERAPYPRNPLEQSPQNEANLLFIHNLVTPYYLRNQRIIKTEGKVILDAGCGTGYASLVLAEANPGAKVVGIDLSAESIGLARQRLEYHNFSSAEFHVLAIADLPSLGMHFDYINIDEVLYLLPNPLAALQAMQSVLTPDGIIRANLHSSLQRFALFRAQKLFGIMGLLDDNPQELEIELVRETMRALKDNVWLKRNTWNPQYATDEEPILLNYLLQGDKGYTIPEMFSALRAAELEWISMVNWRQWELLDLFKEADNLPGFLAMSLPETSAEEQLHLFELLHPLHRLLDFWCGRSQAAQSFVPVAEWTEADWQSARVQLHPQLKTSQIKEDLIDCIAKHRAFEISRHLSAPTTTPIQIDSNMASCLLPLWDGPQSATSLAERWLRVSPVDVVTLEETSFSQAFEEVTELLLRLETFLYVLLERSP